MKRLLLLAFMMCYFSCLFSQITSIGKFHIGISTPSVVEEFALQENIKIKIVSSRYDILEAGSQSKKTKLIALLKEDKRGLSYTQNRFICLDGIKVFYIDHLEISKIVFRDVYLTFANDVLQSFTCDPSLDLGEALRIKYGEPVYKERVDSVKCSSHFIAEFTKRATTFYSIWANEQSNISAILILGKYFNDQCEERAFYNFTLSDEKIMDDIRDQEDSYKRSLEQNRLQLKKKNLDDL